MRPKTKTHHSYFLSKNPEVPKLNLNPQCNWHGVAWHKNNPIGLTRAYVWANNPLGKRPNLNPTFDDEMFALLKNACTP